MVLLCVYYSILPYKYIMLSILTFVLNDLQLSSWFYFFIFMAESGKPRIYVLYTIQNSRTSYKWDSILQFFSILNDYSL